jgi:thiol-disulfide isomerase/thioredoxin
MIKFLYKTLLLTTLVGCGSCVSGGKSVIDSSIEYPWDDCSYSIGSSACDFTLKDQSGKSVSLYDFYGKTIVLDFSTMWCGPCALAASEVQEVSDALSEEGFVYITVVIENANGVSPSLSDCASWAQAYGIEAPVLAGDRSLIDRDGESGWPVTGWPTFFFITKDMTIDSTLKGFSSTYIDELILRAMDQ